MKSSNEPTLADKYTSHGERIVEGVLYGKSQVKVHCPFCGETHYHGRVDGPRASHCMDSSLQSGYYIVIEDSEED